MEPNSTAPDPREVLGSTWTLPLVAFGLYAVTWLVLAIRPVNRQDWFLENLLVFVVVPVLAIKWRRFRFSNLSYVLITAFLILHAYGAHHTYSETPFGNWLGGQFGWERNHYDRLVHFSFGALIALPVWELLARKSGLRPGWSDGLALCVILAGSGLYELLEAAVAMLVDPSLGAAYTGTQGDEWDSQKDMALALAGAMITVGMVAGFRRNAR
ncbi:MAG TPA: DUF2238 domain-containing protein [Verrucomicrobiae bacterium]|nr:DUF2238 domain-containing protein [Verrucomicrobiae bacterium]